jgi:tetratricopeptide (TPR) repeat protein
VTLAIATPLSLWRTRDRPPAPGPIVYAVTQPRDSAGDVSAGAIPLPRKATSKEEWTELLPQLQRAADSGDATARRRLALALYNLRRLDEAQTIYEALLRTKDDAVVRNRLGNTLRDSGDLKDAEAAYRKAIATDPTLPAPYVNLAEILWRTQRDTEADGVLRQGIGAVAPESRAALERAVGYLSTGNDTATSAGD